MQPFYPPCRAAWHLVTLPALFLCALLTSSSAVRAQPPNARQAVLNVSVTVVRSCTIDTRELNPQSHDDALRAVASTCEADSAARVRWSNDARDDEALAHIRREPAFEQPRVLIDF